MTFGLFEGFFRRKPYKLNFNEHNLLDKKILNFHHICHYHLEITNRHYANDENVSILEYPEFLSDNPIRKGEYFKSSLFYIWKIDKTENTLSINCEKKTFKNLKLYSAYYNASNKKELLPFTPKELEAIGDFYPLSIMEILSNIIIYKNKKRENHLDLDNKIIWLEYKIENARYSQLYDDDFEIKFNKMIDDHLKSTALKLKTSEHLWKNE